MWCFGIYKLRKELGMVCCTKSPEGPQNSKRFAILANWDIAFCPNNTCSVLHRMHMQLQLLMAWTKKRVKQSM